MPSNWLATCGVVPFSKSSGTSIRYKPSVSPYANRKLKKLLHLCALAALRHDAEIRAYCEQRAMNESANQNTWSTLFHPAGKDDIVKHYQDQFMPMKLRMLAERVYGSDVMGGQAH